MAKTIEDGSVLKTFLKAVGLMACVAWFNFASAANMGGINVTSALGHPLQAEISLAELGGSDKSTLSAKLASINEFKSAGIDYPYSLPKLSFSIESRSNGSTYLKISSAQPVNDPFVSILIELSWPAGKLLREYTFLLDPAGFAAEQPKPAEVKPVEPIVPVLEPLPAAAVLPVEPVPAVVEAAPEIAVLPLAEEKKEPVLSDMAKAELVAAQMAAEEQKPAEIKDVAPSNAEGTVKVEPLAASPVEAKAESILVEKGDTLGKIARELKPVDVSLERMLVAMYRANAQKFDGRNMNRIKTGKILRMPESSEVEVISQAVAVKEIRAQVADWQDYRQKLAATQSAPIDSAPKQEVAGKVNAAVAEKAPAVKEPAKEVLRLSKGESLGDKAVAAGTAKSKQEKLADKADDAAAKNKQLQEDKKRISDLEKISKDTSKLVELKSRPVTASGDEKALAAASAPVAVKKLVAASAVPVATPVAVEQDILAMIMDSLADPIVLGGAVVVLLGLGGLGFVIARRGKGTQKKSSKKVEDVGSATGSWRTPVAPSPDTGDFTQKVAAAPSPSSSSQAPMAVAVTIDDVDPISEADLFLNFGRDTSAEEILKDALVKTPSNNQIKLKLLSIYVNRKDSKTFSKYAQEIKDSGDTAAWERASVMGRELDPSKPTYGDAKGEPRNREATKAEVDFDLGMGGAAAEPEKKAPAKDFAMDFDLTGAQPTIGEASVASAPVVKPPVYTASKGSADVDATSILSRADLNAAQSGASPMDFDVSGILPGEVKELAAASTTMDFDISGILPGDMNKSAQATSMDFDLTGSHPGIAAIQPEAAASSSAMNFNDLVFEIPTSDSKPADAATAPAFSSDEGMAFTIDFPVTEKLEAPASKPSAENKIDIDFGNININLEDESAPTHVGGEGKDDQWHEVATKLDLAKAYQEMGDADGAREILEEVMRDGDDTQRESAEKLLQQITA
jgi:pilus assembly protein FimV